MGSEMTPVPPRALSLGLALREAREEAGLTVRAVASRVSLSHGTVARYESGDRHPKVEAVAAILDALGVSGEHRTELLELARDVPIRQWVAASSTIHRHQLAALVRYEETATRITSVTPLVIPGLLQTEQYTRAIMAGSELSSTEIAYRIATRIGRQGILDRDVHLVMLVGEGALRTEIGGPSVMLAQLEQLLLAAKRPNVDLRVVPLAQGWHRGLAGNFAVFEFAEPGAIASVETIHGVWMIHEPRDTDACRRAADTVSRAAMTKAESVEVIADQVTQRKG